MLDRMKCCERQTDRQTVALTDEVHKSGSSEPDTDERRHQLTESDAVRRLENVEIL